MGFMYQQRRVELVARVLHFAARLGLADDYVHDAVLLMDRTMSTSLQARLLLANIHIYFWACFSVLGLARASDHTYTCHLHFITRGMMYYMSEVP